MKRAIAALVLLGAIGWLSAISGISSLVASTKGSSVTFHPTFLSRLVAGMWGTFLLALAFGIYRRHPFAWRAGWLLLAACCAGFLVSAIPVILRSEPRPPTSFLVFSVAAVLLGTAGTAIYWGHWWYRQRGYFVGNAG